MVTPVRQDRHPARDARHRLQPVPGQDAQGQAPDLLVGLARRLSRTPRTSCSCSTGRTRKSQVATARTSPNYENPEFDKLLRAAASCSTTGRRSRSVIDEMVDDRAAGRAVDLRLLPVRRPAPTSSGSTTASRAIMIRDHGALLPPRSGAARAQAAPSGTGRSGGRLLLLACRRSSPPGSRRRGFAARPRARRPRRSAQPLPAGRAA